MVQVGFSACSFGVAFVLCVVFGVVCVLLCFLPDKDCMDNFDRRVYPCMLIVVLRLM